MSSIWIGLRGSVKVVSDGPIGGMLRFDLPDVGEAVVIMALDPEGRRFRYILLATSRTGTMQKELNEAAAILEAEIAEE